MLPGQRARWRPAARARWCVERRGRALALGPGDPDHAGAAVLRQPQRGRGGDRHAAGAHELDLGPVDRDARRADQHIAAQQGGGPHPRRRGPARPGACSVSARVRRRRAVEDRDGDRGPRQAARHLSARSERISRPAPQTPMRAPSSSENRTHLPHQDARAPHAHPTAPARPPGRPRSSGAPASTSDTQAPHDGVRAPSLVRGEQPDRGDALLLLADALERLVPAGRGEQGEPGELAGSSSRSRPKISRRCSGELKGASARKTKRHFGQSQHHDAARRAGSILKIALQLVKAPW